VIRQKTRVGSGAKLRHRFRKLFQSRFFAVSMLTSGSTALSAINGVITARILLSEDRGYLAIAVSSGGLIVLIAAFGTNIAVRRLLPMGGLATSRRYVELSCILFIFACIIAILVFPLLFPTPSAAAPSIDFYLVFVFLVAGYFVSSQMLDFLNGAGLLIPAARVNALGTAVVLAGLLFSLLGDPGLTELALCYAISFWFQGAVSVIVSVKVGALTWESGPRAARSFLLYLSTGSKLLGFNVGQSVAYRADVVLLGVMSQAGQAGLYAVASTPASLLRIPANALGQVFMFDRAAGKLSRNFVISRIAWLCFALLPFVAILALSADWLIVFVFGTEYTDASEVFRILLVAEFLLVPFLMASRAMAGRGFIHAAAISGVSGAIVLVALSLVLIPAFGAIGAAWASVVAYGVMSAISVLFLWFSAD
jgi:O-antigen/teichoic acid export membrane protein